MISCSQKEWNGEHGPPSPAREQLDMRIGRFAPEVRDLLGLAARRGPAEKRLADVDARRFQRGDERRLGPGTGPHGEQPGCLVVLEDRSAFGPRKLHRPRDDRGQHLVEIEGRRDRLADLAQGTQLLRRTSQLLEKLHVLDRDRRLGGERGEELDRPVAERIDLEPPEDQDADDPVAHQHRHAQHRAVPTEFPPDRPAVRGIRQHVGNLDDPSLEPDPADERLRTLRHGVALHVLPVLRRAADDERDAVDVTIRLVDVATVGAAQPHGMTHNHLEDGLEPKIRPPDDLEDLAGGRQLLVRLGEFPRELSHARVARDRRFRLSRHGDGPLVRLLPSAPA